MKKVAGKNKNRNSYELNNIICCWLTQSRYLRTLLSRIFLLTCLDRSVGSLFFKVLLSLEYLNKLKPDSDSDTFYENLRVSHNTYFLEQSSDVAFRASVTLVVFGPSGQFLAKDFGIMPYVYREFWIIKYFLYGTCMRGGGPELE